MHGTAQFPETKVSVRGPLGATYTGTVPAQSLPVTVSSANAVGAPTWATILALVLKYGREVLPIILAGLAAGKTWPQILAEVIAALVE